MEKTLGKRIVHHRKQLGLTQDQLAEKLGVTAQAVSKWENDQSCPDITILPKLSDIFGISTDALLGHESPQQACPAEVVDDFHDDENTNAGWEFHWDAGRRHAVGLAVTILAVGILTLCSNICKWDANFWEILWPTSILMFGVFGHGFSFFRLGCIAVGGYFLADNLNIIPVQLGAGILFPALVIILGLALLADTLKKPKKGNFHIVKKGSNKKHKSSYDTSGDHFSYEASFGEATQDITLPRLTGGDICVSFGEYALDFSAVETVSENCTLDASCSFGELTLLIPRRFTVRTDSSTAFAEISIHGEPDTNCQGVIMLDASASFGEIEVRYI